MRTSTLASLLLILALAGLAIQQGPPCMTGQIPDVKLLKGDIHAIDLDTLVSDSQPDLKVEVNVEEADNIASLITTFKDYSPNEYVLEEEKFGQINRCTAYSQGLSDGDWAFLCDKNKIVFVTVNETLGLFDPQRTTVINLAPEEKDKDLTCDSIRNGGTQNLYAVCQKPGSDSIFIFTLDLLAPLRQEPDEIKQPKAEYMLVAPYKLSVNEYITDAGPQISVFIHEREPKTDQLHFRMFKNVRGRLVDGGYFSSKIPGTIKNAKDGRLQNIFVSDEFAFLQTRDAQNNNYLQRCLRNPIYSTFICEKTVTNLSQGDYRIKFFYVDKTKRTTKMVWVYYVSATNIKYDLFDPDTSSYLADVENFEFKGHSLKQVVDYQRAGNNVYLIGPTDPAKPDIADGVVKFKTKTSTWEEFSYGPDASLGLVMQDLHETHFANYLSAGNNKLNFNRIKKNILMYNTQLVGENTASLKVTVSCTGIKKGQSRITFNVDTQLSVNDENSIRVSVPSVEAYVGSSYIYIPSNGDDISGNAPTLKSIEVQSLTNVTAEYLMINPEQPSFPEDFSVQGITGFKHVGESWFLIENAEKLSFVQCLKTAQGLKCTDTKVSVDLKTEDYEHVNTEITDGVALVLLSQRPPQDPSKTATATPKTVIKAVRLEDGQTEFDDLTYPFYTKVGRVRVLDQMATLVLAGADRFSSNVDMHYLRFNMSGKTFPRAVGSLTSFHNHICPSQISWAPRSSSIVYVASVCDKSGIDNHVFKYDIDFEKPFLSQITEVYVIEGSREFNICAQDRLLNIVDMERDIFYSFDTHSSINAKLSFPTKEYGIKEIKTYACDQNNNILQIVGCTDKEFTNCYLLTYRANLAHVPNKRVHSVQKIDSKVEFIASSFNDENDDTITMLIGKDTASAQAFLVEVDGPHLRLRAGTQVTDGGNFKVKENFAFMGENGVVNDDKLKIVPAEHNLTLVPQAVDIKVQLTKPTDKPMMDGKALNLDDFVTITGPFHSLQATTVEGAVLIDRMSPYEHFTGLEPTFDDAMYHQNFVFGYKKDGVYATLGVYSVGKKHIEVANLDKVSDLQFVAKSDKAFYFFALVKKQYKKDSIYTIYTTNGGDTWTTAHTSLDAEGYKIMEVNNGPDKYFVFGGYNNLRGYKSMVFAFTVEGKTIDGSAPVPFKFEDNIADYDINFIEGTRNVIVVAGVEYSKQAEFFWYEIDASGYMSLIGQQQASLVPNVQETHEDVVFRCEQRNGSVNFLWCINSGKNLYSYFVKYQLDWTKPTTGLATNFIKKSFIHTRLRNIVNLKAIKVDLLDDYISFMVKNLYPVKTGAVAHPGAFFADSFMCLTYKVSSNAEPVEVGEIPTRDVFKILTMGDLEITNVRLLENLDPRYFKSTDGVPKLGINVGTSGKSIKVFNVNGLGVTLDDTKDPHREFEFSFRTIKDGVVSKLMAKDIFTLRKKPEPEPKDGPCFQGKIPDVKLLKGDQHAIDLDEYLVDSKIELDTTSENTDIESWIGNTRTFNWDPSDYDLEESKFGKIQGCTSYSAGLSDGDWAFLCDQNKIVFVTVNETTGKFDDQRTTVINLATPEGDDAETTCDSLRHGGTQNLYVICSRPTDNNIYIYSLDLLAPIRRDPQVILQPESESKLKAPYKLWVDEYSTDAGSQVVLIIHEREPTSPELKFKMLKSNRGKLVDGGYFSTDLPKTVLNAQKGQLQSVFVNDEFVILQTRVENKNYLQRCLRNPVYSQFKCDKTVTTLAEGDFRIKLFYVDKTKRTTHMTWVYYVSNDVIKYDLYDPDSGAFVENVGTVNFKGHSLRKIVDYQRAGNNFFLIGPTDDLKIADGVVKVKTKSSTWEEYSFGPTASLGLVMQDLHETHYANYLSVGSNKISFKRIKKNIMTINTANAEPDKSAVTVTVKCKGQLKDTRSTLSFKVNTQIDVNDDSSIKVNIPKVEAYIGSAEILIGTNGDDFAGNAPTLKDSSIDTLKNVKSEILMLTKEEFTYEAKALAEVTGLKHVGEKYFALESKDTLIFVYCEEGDSGKLVCKNTDVQFDLKQEKEQLVHIHTEVVDDLALIVLATVPPTAAGQSQTPKTIIHGISLIDNQAEFEAKTYEFYTKFGRVRVLDQQVTIIFAGAPAYGNLVDMHYLHFDASKGKFPTSIGSLTSFKNHMCPAQISWAPRSSNVLYVSSICDKNGLNNHVFKYDIDFEKPFKSQITEVYVVESSRDFRICAQERLLNIIDMERDVFYSFDTRSAIDSKLYFPTKTYGINHLRSYSCDQNNNILQVIGCTDDKQTSCYLLTYRANLAHVPNKRVHSVQKIDSKVEFIASSFNDENDDTLTFLLGKSTDTKYLYTLEVDGPHLRLKAENENTEGTFVIKENFAFMGENGVVNDDKLKIVPAEHNLTLVAQATKVEMALLDPKKKLKADNSLQIVEDFVTITGPYHSLVVDPASKVQINDRMTPTLQFSTVEKTWQDSIFYKDFIFGHDNDGGATSTLAVYKGDTPKATVPNLDKVSDLQFVAKSDKAFYFFALVKRQYKKDSIYTIYTTNGGDTWTTAHTELDAQGYKIAEIKNGPGDWFVFGGYNNRRGYKVVSLAFTVDGKNINGNAGVPYTLSDNIVDFDVTFIEGTRNVIVVAGVEYAKQATFLWYQVDEAGIMSLIGVQQSNLVPNESETHEGIVFKCEQRNSVVENLWCVNSGRNLYSYVVKYQLDWTKPTTGLATNFIKSGTVETRLRNIVNLRPTEVDANEEYITFLVKNLMPIVETEGQSASPGRFFADTHMILTYKITSNTATSKDDDVPVRDVFKILTKEDLGVENAKDLENLVPRYFKDTEGKTRLGINVGIKKKSIKVFNLNPLSMILDSKIEAHRQFSIKLKMIDNKQTTAFKVADFFELGPSSEPGKGKSSLTLIMIIGIVLALIALGVVGFIVSQKSQPSDLEEPVMDDVEKTMKLPDETHGDESKL